MSRPWNTDPLPIVESQGICIFLVNIYMNVLNCVLKIECNNTNILSNSTLFVKYWYIHFNYKL